MWEPERARRGAPGSPAALGTAPPPATPSRVPARASRLRPRGPALPLESRKPRSNRLPRARPHPRLGRTSGRWAVALAGVSEFRRLPAGAALPLRFPCGPSPKRRGRAAPGRRPAGGPPLPAVAHPPLKAAAGR